MSRILRDSSKIHIEFDQCTLQGFQAESLVENRVDFPVDIRTESSIEILAKTLAESPVWVQAKSFSGAQVKFLTGIRVETP